MTTTEPLSYLKLFMKSLPEEAALFDTDLKYQYKTDLLSESHLQIFLRYIDKNLNIKNKILFDLKNSKKTSLSFDFEESHTCVVLSELKLLEMNFIYIKIQDSTKDIQIKNEIEKINLIQINNGKIKELAEVSSGISHEINNPLTIIVAKTQYIKKEIEKTEILNKAKILESIDKISLYSDRITKIIKSLKSFSRNTDKDNPESVLISSLVEDSFNLLNEQIRNSGIQIDMDLTTMNINIECVPSEIIQVLVNLIKNAIDALKEHRQPSIQIRIDSLENKKIKINICDNGAGIALDQTDKIFKSFYTTKPSGQGTGLGLSLSKYLALKNNGDLYLDSKANQTCFCLVLCRSRF